VDLGTTPSQNSSSRSTDRLASWFTAYDQPVFSQRSSFELVHGRAGHHPDELSLISIIGRKQCLIVKVRSHRTPHHSATQRNATQSNALNPLRVFPLNAFRCFAASGVNEPLVICPYTATLLVVTVILVNFYRATLC